MALIIGGETVPCAAHVIDWRAHGKQFTADMKNIGKRGKRPKPQLLVTHWTGGERPNEDIYATLRNRGYGVEFTMDSFGHIWQHCDPHELYTAHAGGVNLVSFGIEIQNQGLYPHPAWSKTTQARMDKKWNRGRYRDYVGGRERSMAMFNVEQLDAYLEFCDALAGAGVIPRQVPLRKDKMIIHSQDPLEADFEVGLLNTDRIAKAKRSKLKGVCGHFHVHNSKVDPGTQPLEALIDHWEL
jgi:hypothetical protein